MTGRAGTVVTFYSHKGGVGRTFLLCNVAVALAAMGLRVLVVDWDLDAPGARRYLEKHPRWPLDRRMSPARRRGLLGWLGGELPSLDGFAELVDLRAPDVPAEVFDPTRPGGLWLIDAGDGTLDHLAAVSDRAEAALAYRPALEEELPRCVIWMKQHFDVTLIDSRTGAGGISRLTLVHLADVAVAVMTMNFQSIEGALEVTRLANALRVTGPYPERGELPVLPVLSRVDNRGEEELFREWEERVRRLLTPTLRRWTDASDDSLAKVISALTVPAVPRWTYGEPLPMAEVGDTLGVGDPLLPVQILAAAVAQGPGSGAWCARDPFGFVQGARDGRAEIELSFCSAGDREGDDPFTDDELYRELVWRLSRRHVVRERLAGASPIAALVKVQWDARGTAEPWPSTLRLVDVPTDDWCLDLRAVRARRRAQAAERRSDGQRPADAIETLAEVISRRVEALWAQGRPYEPWAEAVEAGLATVEQLSTLDREQALRAARTLMDTTPLTDVWRLFERVDAARFEWEQDVLRGRGSLTWRPPPATAQRAGRTSGFVLVADVVEFRKLESAEQRRLMNDLVRKVSAFQAVQGTRAGAGWHVRVSGDALMLTVAERFDVGVGATLVQDALRLLAEARAQRRPLRAAIHQVRYFGVEVPGAARELGGYGFGHARQVADLAFRDQLLVTQEALDAMDEVDFQYLPPSDQLAWSVPLKPGRVARIRLVWPEGREAWRASVGPSRRGSGAGPERPYPRKVFAQRFAQQILGELMAEFAETFRGWALECAFDVGKAAPRFTLWGTDQEEPTGLVSSEYRVDSAGRPLPPSGTSYRLVSRRSTSPVVGAFLDQEVRFCVNLPDPTTDEAAYLSRWSRMGVDREMVKRFSRRPRAVIAVPLAFDPQDPWARAVLCVDLMSPLPGRAAARELADLLFSYPGEAVAALWYIRRS